MGKKDALTILNSVKLQNRIIDLMPQFSQESFEKARKAMGEVDATCELGHCATNQIIVNETWGENTYLSRLIRNNNDQRMIFHCLGSTVEAIDIFELISEDGQNYDILYVDMYHRHCSSKVSTGCRLLKNLDGIIDVNQTVETVKNNRRRS